MKIGKKIQQLRKEKEMTQRDLANRLNVSPQAISRWENDEVEPSIETLSQMSEIFSVSLDELFGRATQRSDDEKSNTTTEPLYLRPPLALCEKCNQPIYKTEDIVRTKNGEEKELLCRRCDAKRKLATAQGEEAEYKKDLRRSIIWAALAVIVGIITGVVGATQYPDMWYVAIILPICAGSFAFCIRSERTFVSDMWHAIASWSISMPGIICDFDLEGIFDLIVMKAIFAISGGLVAILMFLLATVAALAVAPIALPFAIEFLLKDIAEAKVVQNTNSAILRRINAEASVAK